MIMKLSMNEFTTNKWTFKEDVHQYSFAGYRGIGVSREKIKNLDINTATKYLKDYDLEVSELCSIGHLVCKDLDTQSYYLKDAKFALQTASSLQARSLLILAGFEPSFDHSQSLAALRSSIEKLLPLAEHYNVRLALEPLHPMYKASLSFLVSLQETLDFVNQFSSEFLGVWLDTQHIWWDTQLHKNILRAGNKIFGVHLNDWLENNDTFYNWGLPGKGIIPLKDILISIKSAGWNDMFSIEVISENTQPNKYPELLDYCLNWGKNNIP